LSYGTCSQGSGTVEVELAEQAVGGGIVVIQPIRGDEPNDLGPHRAIPDRTGSATLTCTNVVLLVGLPALLFSSDISNLNLGRSES
jgi:hypothetical protein